MLRSHPRRRRDGRHRLYALALDGHHQAHAVVPQWLGPLRMSHHTHEFLDIGTKPRFTGIPLAITHLSPHADVNVANYLIPSRVGPRLSDSVKLEHDPEKLQT